MQVANCRCLLNPGHDVAKKNVTPAEVVVLRSLHQRNVGKDPVTDLIVLGTIERSNATEVARLRMIYGEKAVKPLFPGINGEGISETFEGVWPAPVQEQRVAELPTVGTELTEPITPLGSPVE